MSVIPMVLRNFGKARSAQFVIISSFCMPRAYLPLTVATRHVFNIIPKNWFRRTFLCGPEALGHAVARWSHLPLLSSGCLPPKHN